MKKLIVSLFVLVGFISLRIISDPNSSPVPLQAYIKLLRAEKMASEPWNSADLQKHFRAEARLKKAQLDVGHKLRKAQGELDAVWLRIHQLRSQRDSCEQLLLLGKRGQWEKCKSFLNPGKRWIEEEPKTPITQQERDAATAKIQKINQQLQLDHEIVNLAKAKVHQAEDEITKKKEKAQAAIDAAHPAPPPLKQVINRGKRVLPSPSLKVKGWLTRR